MEGDYGGTENLEDVSVCYKGNHVSTKHELSLQGYEFSIDDFEEEEGYEFNIDDSEEEEESSEAGGDDDEDESADNDAEEDESNNDY